MKPLKKSLINTFKRVGIDYASYSDTPDETIAINRFTGEECPTSFIVKHCIEWVYTTNNRIDAGDTSISIADFDKVRYFVLERDKNAYAICLD